MAVGISFSFSMVQLSSFPVVGEQLWACASMRPRRYPLNTEGALFVWAYQVGGNKSAPIIVANKKKNIYIYISTCICYITPSGGMLLVYNPDSQGRIAPERGMIINRNIPTGRCYSWFIPALLGDSVPPYVISIVLHNQSTLSLVHNIRKAVRRVARRNQKSIQNMFGRLLWRNATLE